MATITRIVKHLPKGNSRYFVDSNVWFWFTYASANEMFGENAPRRYQTEHYPNFIQKVLDEGARLFHSPLNLAELASIIERTEYNLFIEETSEPDLKKKEFRRLEDRRRRVVEQIHTAWKTIEQCSECLDINLNSKLANNALDTLANTQLDPYDAYYIDCMQQYEIENIITDDSDFLTAEVNIFTANANLHN